MGIVHLVDHDAEEAKRGREVRATTDEALPGLHQPAAYVNVDISDENIARRCPTTHKGPGGPAGWGEGGLGKETIDIQRGPKGRCDVP